MGRTVYSDWTRPLHIFFSALNNYMNNKWTSNMNFRWELMEAGIVLLDLSSGEYSVC